MNGGGHGQQQDDYVALQHILEEDIDAQGQEEGAAGHSYIPVNCLHPPLIPVTEPVAGPSGTSGKNNPSSSDSGCGNSSVEDISVHVLNYQNIPG